MNKVDKMFGIENLDLVLRMLQAAAEQDSSITGALAQVSILCVIMNSSRTGTVSSRMNIISSIT